MRKIRQKAIVTINDMENLVIIFAISKCEFYNFEKENIKYAHIQYYLFYFTLNLKIAVEISNVYHDLTALRMS